MIDRRTLLQEAWSTALALGAFGIIGCGREDAIVERAVRSAVVELDRASLYDVYAMALYFDGGLGPRTGIIRASDVLKGQPLDFDFWHGHGGNHHRFTVTAAHLTELKKLKKVFVETTLVDGHSHKLFIDPVDPKWRVAGAKPVPIPSREIDA